MLLRKKKWIYSRFSYFGVQNPIHSLLDIGLENVGLGQFAFPVSCQPDLGQRSFFAEHKVSVEHDGVKIDEEEKTSESQISAFFNGFQIWK